VDGARRQRRPAAPHRLSGQSAPPAHHGRRRLAWLAARDRYLCRAAARRGDRNAAGAQVIAQHDRPDTLFYIDPPYMFDTRSQKRKGNDLYHGYNHELTDAQHVELLELVLSLQGMVVSGYASDLYETRLAGWRRVEKAAQADRGSPRTEVLWINPAFRNRSTW
jgi:site-specific DNA-adenine methylase